MAPTSFIYLPSWACPTLHFTHWGPGKTKGLAQAHSSSPQLDGAKLICRSMLPARNQNRMLPTPWFCSFRLPSANMTTHVSSQDAPSQSNRPPVPFTIMTTFECPKIIHTQCETKSFTLREFCWRRRHCDRKRLGSEPLRSFRSVSGALCGVISLLTLGRHEYALLQSRYVT